MAETHTLTIKAELDTSGIQGKLDQLNNQKQRAPGASSSNGVALANQLTKLDRTLANLTKAVNQLAAGQKSTGGLGTAARSPVVVNAGGGLGPMLIPQLNGATVASTLMNKVAEATLRHYKQKFDTRLLRFTPEMVKGFAQKHGQTPQQMFEKAYQQYRTEFQSLMQQDPVSLYHAIFSGGGLSKVPLSTKLSTRLSMLNQAPLAALGIGPKSWRAAQLSKQRTFLSTEAKKGIAGMVVGSMLSPALDYVSNYVYKDPTDWRHVLTKVGTRAIASAGTGALIGFGSGTATTGVGGMPAAGAGAIVGGFIGLAEGIFDAWSEVKEYELKTAEDLKRYNDQIRANWQKIAEALPKAQLSIELRRGTEQVNYLASMADTTAIRQMRGPLVDRLGQLKGERLLIENQILEFQKSGDKYADTLKGAGLLKRLDQLNSKIANEEANLKTIDAAIAADDANAAAEDLQRETMLKTVGALQAKQALAAEGRQVGLLAQFGTRGQLEAALSEYGNKMRDAASARDKAAAEMKAAAEDGREEAFDEARERYQTQLSLLDTLAGFRGSIGQALSQMIASSMPNYTGLQASQLGHLAAIGGFGSASALADPSLELTRQQVDLLREILRKIPEETAALYS